MTTALYIKSLEKKVCDVEARLDREATRSSGSAIHCGAASSASFGNGRAGHAAETPSQSSARSEPQPSDEDVIETMIGAGEDDLLGATSMGHYRGSFAGLNLLQRVQNLCRHLTGKARNPTIDERGDDFVHAFDFPPPSSRSTVPWETLPLLPLPESMDHAIDVVVNQACCNMQFLDCDNLRSIARHIYAEAENGSRDHHRKSFTLLYAVLALARRFEAVPSTTATTTGEGATNG
jgi:hypothetical protein